MDNTYNSHEHNFSGHGTTGWYAPDNTRRSGEHLASGATETFSYHGCQMTLRVQDNPADRVHTELLRTSTYTFNLRDINPQSIKMSTLAHMGGDNCEKFSSQDLEDFAIDCDHAEISFVTHGEAPLIDWEYTEIFPKLQGKDHELKGKRKKAVGYFLIDNVEYARRFATAFRHAVDLCGGKPEPF